MQAGGQHELHPVGKGTRDGHGARHRHKKVYEDGDKIRCVSYNPEYPDFSMEKDEIYSMSLVVGLLRM